MILLHEIAIFQTMKSKVIISLFETVGLSVSISLRNLYSSLNSIQENVFHDFGDCCLFTPTQTNRIYHRSVSDADREIQTLGSTDNAENEVDPRMRFSVCIGDLWLIIFLPVIIGKR